MSEEEPIEAILERFEHVGLVFAMVTPPKSMKLGSSQVRQLPRMTSQAQTVDESSLEQRKRKRRKLKVRNKKRRPTWMAVRVEFPRRSHGKKKRTKKQASETQKNKRKKERNEGSQNGIQGLYS